MLSDITNFVTSMFKDYKSLTIFVIFLFVILIGVFIVMSSDISTKYIIKNLAKTSANITKEFQDFGMNEVEVEGKINLGITSFKITAKDDK